MASNLQGGRSIARRVVNQIWIGGGGRDPAPASRRGVHVSVYDKNLDEQVRPGTVPDDVIQLQSDKYWAPNPNTGVFGPADQNGAGGDRHFSLRGGHTAASPSENGGSVLDQTVWFRPLEGVEKPQQA